ncbi:unnamed protein product [Eruca vesicaria subsp. sativa]|uniref:RING-type E3 ubiquitin transferase n=1 Tax=Eruca vesicaria subsp. sativa TaxID=29727 RepID=A0ABC8IWI6_ERUVS|nr:unnamed protein product [Eruca vesicaria subsp. sativa]
MLAQHVFGFCEFITVYIFLASIVVFTLRIFQRFATVLINRPWSRHRTFTFRSSQGRLEMVNDHSSSSPYCVVCMQEAEEGDKMRRLTICLHCFHAECIDTWFCEMSTCPLCRAEIPPLPPVKPLLLLFVSAGVLDFFSNK